MRAENSEIKLRLREGVIAAVPTPVARSAHPDIDRFLRHCRWALDNGCDGLDILGTTGEANSFGFRARQAIMVAAAEELDRNRLMVGTGTPDLDTTIALTRLAGDLDYAAALVLPPFYYKPVTDEGLFRYFKSLCDATKADPVPIFLYNFPALTGVPFSISLIRRLWSELDGRVCGIKDSSGDMPYCREIVKEIPGFRVFPSSETCLATALEDGFAGCISATVNISAPLCGRVWRARVEGVKKADADEIARLRTTIATPPLIPTVKHLIARRFNDSEWMRLLPPLMELTTAQAKTLEAIDLYPR